MESPPPPLETLSRIKLEEGRTCSSSLEHAHDGGLPLTYMFVTLFRLEERRTTPSLAGMQFSEAAKNMQDATYWYRYKCKHIAIMAMGKGGILPSVGYSNGLCFHMHHTIPSVLLKFCTICPPNKAHSDSS